MALNETRGDRRTASWDESGQSVQNSQLRHRLAGEFLSDLKDWFAGYVRMFRTGDSQTQRNIDLKAGHTRRVCREIVALGKKLGLRDNALRLTEAIALLHAVGHFEQYAKYKTFRDGR